MLEAITSLAARLPVARAFGFVLLLLAIMPGAVACTTANVGTVAGVTNLRTYVGSLTASSSSAQTPLVAFMVAPSNNGTLDVRAYMCDGIESGELFWVRGAAVPAAEGHAFDLTSASGYRVKGVVSLFAVAGTITNTAAGDLAPLSYNAARAVEGAGIFDIVAAADGSISGTSLSGDSLQLARSASAQAAEEDGQVYTGSIATTDGKGIEVELVDLSTLPADVLEENGFATGHVSGEQGVAQATFRAIVQIQDGGFVVFGRVLLPGTGVNGVPPKFGVARVALASRLGGRL